MQKECGDVYAEITETSAVTVSEKRLRLGIPSDNGDISRVIDLGAYSCDLASFQTEVFARRSPVRACALRLFSIPWLCFRFPC
jgi:hypothetical protein